MIGEPGPYTAILVMAAVTLFTRLLGPEIMLRVAPSPAVERFLEGLATAVLAGIVASFLAQNGLREAAAVAIAVVVMLIGRSAALAMLVGMLVAAVWSNLPV